MEMIRPHIEVETKFILPKNLEERLQDEGAVFMREIHHSDSYFDNSSCSLTLQDNWLRKRDKSWELKVPAGEKTRGKERGIDGYNEVKDEREIVQHLSRCLGLDSNSQRIRNVRELMETASLLPFASYGVTRKTYSLTRGSFTLHVDLDKASYGYEIGELEILVQNDSEIFQAKQTLKEVAEKLGIRWGTGVHGKMDEYLRRFRQEHYQLLLNHGVVEGGATNCNWEQKDLS